ncbi:tumor suppressor, Mitostatin-domain-containing protein [Fimicolochytrium jonesii]|uniref:tumor suppressor, Mitostatin-domain-containing protein n=1 Tax=Fimicolochytrium jonesii TaxID=1396493 RepID=UPI0022FE1CFE|nr:tumor suppressor, Mitostatin-domain-containing protein [Fimicolochytrium jonesii]KAI8821359.1 tumor suppressor, Mitostatin-domain-containing protein [Fimicolochytrium jonesii]
MATLFQLGSKPDHLPMLPGLPAQHHRAHAGRRAHHHGQRSDYLIAARRRAEQNREQMQHQIQYYDRTQQQSRFEEYTEDSMRRSRVSERFKQLKVEEDGKLEERRERLRQRIAQDEDRYQAELVASRPTKESRVYAMRARVSELKAKREAERQAVVGDKLLQRWRNECDELRVVESKILETEVTNARASQLIEHEQKRALAVQEKQYYDQLWEQDRLKKIEREEKDNQIRRERDLATKLALEEQLKLLRLNAENEERLKQEQGVLMAQEIELQRLAEERAHEQKLQSQRLIRLDLDTFNKNRILARQKEVQEALELDLKIVNAFFRMDEQEREKQSRRKEELKREMKMYMDYLREQRRVEAEREREIEELYAQENAKLWQTRTEKWQREQAARDRLMQEVIAGRKEQLQHSCEWNLQLFIEWAHPFVARLARSGLIILPLSQ